MSLTVTPQQRRRWVELALLFGLAPAVISLGPRWLVLVTIIGGGGLALAMLRADPSFPRGSLLHWDGLAVGWRAILLRAVFVCVGLLALAFFTGGAAGLFHLPRTRPGLWAAVVVLYTVVSVVPQEILFRTFFFHRYQGLFRRREVMLLVNGALFGWAHIIVHNRIAVLLATAGGLLFASTFQRWRSTALVAFEHALYGGFIFSVGIGGMFVNGVRLLSRVLP